MLIKSNVLIKLCVTDDIKLYVYNYQIDNSGIIFVIVKHCKIRLYLKPEGNIGIIFVLIQCVQTLSQNIQKRHQDYQTYRLLYHRKGSGKAQICHARDMANSGGSPCTEKPSHGLDQPVNMSKVSLSPAQRWLLLPPAVVDHFTWMTVMQIRGQTKQRLPVVITCLIIKVL